MLVYNCDGVPQPERDLMGKLRAIAMSVLGAEESEQPQDPAPHNACDVVVLLETRTSHVASRLQPLLPGYRIFMHAVANEGRKGQGVAVLVRDSLSDHVQLIEVPGDLQCIWLKFRGEVFGVQGPVLFGGAYIPPQSDVHTAEQLEGLYEQLLDGVERGAAQGCTHTFISGDFNAHLGRRSEFTHEHYALQARFPELGQPRRIWGNRVVTNLAGRLLTEVCGLAPGTLVLTTGRGRGGDMAEPTCRGATRTEHVLLSPHLYEKLQHVECLPRIVESDHCPLRVCLVGEAIGLMQDEGQHHECGEECNRLAHALFRLNWKHGDDAAAQRYAARLLADEPGMAQFRDALNASNVDLACAILMGMIHSAAIDSGMASAWRCPLRRRGAQVRHQPWFNAQCKQAKQAYLQAVWSGAAPHAHRALKKELRRIARRSKRSYVSQRAHHFLALLRRNHPEAYDMVKHAEKPARQPTPIAMAVLEEYGREHFGHRAVPEAGAARAAGAAAMRAAAPVTAATTAGPAAVVAQPAASDNAVAPPAEPPPVRRTLWQTLQQGAVRVLQPLIRAPVQRLAMHFGLVRGAHEQPPPAPAPPAPVLQPPPPPYAVAPDLDKLSGVVSEALSRLKGRTSAGLDGLPAAFVKHAVIREGRDRRQVLAPLLGEMFLVCMRDGVLPSAWKLARITPLYKKGPVLSPESYRLLAVSSVLYRLYANSMRAIMTEWCVATSKVPDEQFGFYPGRDTTQPGFVLRHVCHAARWAKLKGQRRDSRVYAAFMDFTQAYDKVDRGRLWQHLQSVGMPPWMLGAVQGMYDRDAYMFVDGGRTSGQIHPTKGVKQGCPLSPLLFALYMNDFGSRMAVRAHGVPMHGQPQRKITFMFYADDLVLLAESRVSLQRLLESLESYSMQKGLAVNAAKSKVVVFNSQQGGAQAEQFWYRGERLEVVAEFKYLGLVFQRELCMSKMQEPWAQALLGGWSRCRRIAKHFGVQNSVTASHRLFQSFAFPAGMYGCQVWGTRFAHMDRIFDSAVSIRQMGCLRRLLGVSSGCYRWAVLAELNAKPYHWYWVKALLKFHSSALQSNSSLLREVMQADALLARESCMVDTPDGPRVRTCESCWTAEMARALESIGQATEAAEALEMARSWAELMRQGNAVTSASSVMAAVQSGYDKLAWQECVGREGSLRLEGAVVRKRLTYYTHFKPASPVLPAYLRLDAGFHRQIQQMARFRLSCHKLGVERGRRGNVAWCDRVCTRCSAQHRATLGCQVDDEHHMIFECELFQGLRQEVVEYVPGSRSFVPGVGTLLAQADGCVRRFMEGDPKTVVRFIARCMDMIDSWMADNE